MFSTMRSGTWTVAGRCTKAPALFTGTSPRVYSRISGHDLSPSFREPETRTGFTVRINEAVMIKEAVAISSVKATTTSEVEKYP